MLSFFRALLLCAILFLGCYWWAGGSDIIELVNKHIGGIEPAGQTVPAEQQDNDNDGGAATAWRRAYRFIALPQAIDDKINRHRYTSLDEISLFMQQAILAIEDTKFYSHYGFDPEGMIRATLVNIQSGHIEEGASTITQQLAKNLFLSQERSMSRKAEEFMWALNMELRLPKERILELYLNSIYFGSNYYGIGEAADGYFAKKPADLTLAEAAMLAGLPQAPSLYSPYENFAAAKERQAVVLDRMATIGMISPTLAAKTKTEPVYLAR